jgi:hypothetical protein
MLSEAGMVGDVDQDTLMLTVGAVPGLSLATLDARWCATPADVVADPIILHDSASRDVRRSRGTVAYSGMSFAASRGAEQSPSGWPVSADR